MTKNKDLTILLLAAFLTTIVLEAAHQLVLPFSLSLSSSLSHPYVMLAGWVLAVVTALIAGLPSALVLQRKKVPNGLLVGVLGALEGFLAASVIAAIVLASNQAAWLLISFIAQAASYVVIHRILNRRGASQATNLVWLGIVLIATAALTTITPYLISATASTS